MKRLILGFFLLIFVTSCQRGNVPEGIIEMGKMISVLTDVHVIDSYVSTAAYDTTTLPAKEYYKVVYQKYKIDSLQLQKSLRYYSNKPELLDTMYYQVLRKLETMEQLENMNQQRQIKARKAVEVQKQNAAIRLKPQPHWFFKYDTAGLFDRFDRSNSLPLNTPGI